SVGPFPIVLGANATASANAIDAVSGVATQTCGSVDTSTAGVHTVACTATDNAGNTNTATVSYVMSYNVLGFLPPVAPGSSFRRSQTVPLRIALANAIGVRIPDAEAAAMLSPACRVFVTASGAQSTSGCMKYDAANHQFVFNWMLGKGATGPATITV